jgi:putative ABC transport system permease protein
MLKLVNFSADLKTGLFIGCVSINTLTMLINYLKLALRLLIRSPFFSIINITGLSIGFAVFFGLWDFTGAELRTDRQAMNYERIARACVDWRWTDDGKNWGYMKIAKFPTGTVSRIAQDFEQVEAFTRIMHQPDFNFAINGHGNQVILQYDGAQPILFKEQNIVYADRNIFEFFSIPLLLGAAGSVLAEANSIVLSETTARKYFGLKDPRGQLLQLNKSMALKVTGVFKDLPRNTHLIFDAVISNAGQKERWNESHTLLASSYVRIRDEKFQALETNVQKRTDEYWADVIRTYPQARAAAFFQPLKDVAFDSQGFQNQPFQPKSKTILKVFAGVAIVILLMAWVNYLNLTIARMSRRSKEIAARKMSGAGASDFTKQFVIEAVVINLIAVAFAATILQVIRQPANVFLGLRIGSVRDIEPATGLVFMTIILAGILTTALYPVIISMKRSPSSLFKLHFRGRTGNAIPLMLTTIQYAAGIVLIYCGISIHQQLNYIFNKELGYDKTNVFLIDAPVTKTQRYVSELYAFKSIVEEKPYQQGVAVSTPFLNLKVQRPGASGSFIMTDGFGISAEYIPFMKFKLIAGRNFQVDEKNDVVIVSRLTCERLGYPTPEQALGEQVETAIGADGQITKASIIGIIEDFRIRPFYQAETHSEAQTGRGFSFMYSDRAAPAPLPESILVRLDGRKIPEALADLEKSFTAIFPGNVFSGNFMEQQVLAVYNNEKLVRNQIAFITCLAVIIACLGLLAMVSNKVEEKIREIGIRKALGAGAKHISRVLLDSTVVQIIVAIAVGMPIAWMLSETYLQRYSERLPISWWHFVVPAALLCAILLGTVSAVLARAIRTNPADTLRHE